jgi:hypothetical protein
MVTVYFTGTRLQRWMSVATLILLTLGILGLRKYPALMFVGPKTRISNGSIAFGALLSLVPIVGVLTLFFSAALMPIVFGHLARSKQLHVLPYARSKLLVSVVLVLGIVAVMFAVVVEALYASFPIDHGVVFGKAVAIAALTFSPMYVFVWLISRAKGALGSLGGAMLIIPCLALPFHFVQIPQPPMRMPLTIGGMSFVVCAGAFLLAPSRRHPGGESPGLRSGRDTSRAASLLCWWAPRGLGCSARGSYSPLPWQLYSLRRQTSGFATSCCAA